jgi:hypothetical protein
VHAPPTHTPGLAFDPGAGKAKGIFPLSYLRGLEAQLLAVGPSALDVCLLQDKVPQHLRYKGGYTMSALYCNIICLADCYVG